MQTVSTPPELTYTPLSTLRQVGFIKLYLMSHDGIYEGVLLSMAKLGSLFPIQGCSLPSMTFYSRQVPFSSVSTVLIYDAVREYLGNGTPLLDVIATVTNSKHINPANLAERARIEAVICSCRCIRAYYSTICMR